ncbi:MAG: PstS family phosphate ABC transporter substrate-binding protein [gamma proteobacterium symbiont of Bathyaustriella thionipta]|nr:PstS family phosphate ABC transporter substrate-binding protein [gamma proteobacterium symbiont of Bathyaustriella thionipta]MCU7951044.1 PstS family phosphate ABC transporter substrate-binding protein [gamma proteobacterium symbiont of Bathyaustriella thionipta]MCU7951981.1 PstS family phosphate ABC transporter substrate-binding protein [gamma proteobacterium symbiont of Bathyaustriella thionipta]MCU7957552.1 PstS family phosphate ABC transporter substrate-binding protein [gamma proteobacter
MIFRKSALSLIATGAIVISSINMAQARDQIRIVGSSTVYPFSSSVAEEFGATSKNPTPVVESTGSGGGMKLFCKGNALNTPDITNASRRMKAKEFKLCEKNGVTDITEAVIGFDGIAIAHNKNNKPLELSKKHLLLAVAEEVPSKDGKSLVKNPYKKWNEIDSTLPEREIIIYGPPTSSGTRDAFEDMIMKGQTKKMDVYTSLYKKDKVKNKGYKKYHKVRQDGIYVPSGENDNLIVQKLSKNPAAIGIFGYSFLIENDDKVAAAKINGVLPTPETISSGQYPISRSLFFYTKNSHRKEVPAMDKYVELFMKEDMIGPEGILGEIGLIALPDERRNAIRSSVAKYTKLTLEDLSKK